MNNLIDSETGLPNLPEGHFWRIKEHSVEIRKRIEDTGWAERPYGFYGYGGFEDEIGTAEYREVNRVRNVERVKKSFARGPVVETIDEWYVEQQVRYVNRSTVVAAADAPQNGETTVQPAHTIPATWREVYDYYSRYSRPRMVTPAMNVPPRTIHHLERVTEENVLEIAEKAMKHMKANDLVGDYPPKKVGESK